MEDYKKKYEQAFEKAKEVYNRKDATDSGKLILESMFPELKESENEKMWKLIKKYAHNNISDMALNADHITRKELEDWLEKQGEQKPSITVHKFRVGDNVKTLNEGPLVITKIDDKGYWSGELFISDFDDEVCWELVKQKPAWSEKEERYYDSAL